MQTKTGEVRYFKAMLKPALIDYVLQGDDLQRFLHLFENYYKPDAGEERYLRKDITQVCIRKNPPYNTICIMLQVDGKYISCSLNRMGTAPSNDALLHRAMRWAIDPQIRDYSNQNKVCNNCNSRANLEVDHNIPFAVLSAGWQQENNISATKLPEIKYNDQEKMYHFCDTTLRDNWFDFHQKNATLQTLCVPCHNLKTEKERNLAN